jgi:hypothetical protein
MYRTTGRFVARDSNLRKQFILKNTCVPIVPSTNCGVFNITLTIIVHNLINGDATICFSRLVSVISLREFTVITQKTYIQRIMGTLFLKLNAIKNIKI